ncbi:hypothetical protein SJC12_9 [Bacteroides phage SJC12]|nr:hypothetical protein SJC12_9 [Bacteroides phage SJC12]QIG65183.1 hypothetical protein SJC14_9 [Bacteroides phage SJC14]QIG65331.1 hypothetical protein SJC17_9 [Bacteroides phage SJC17]
MELGIEINRRMLDGVTGDLKLSVVSADPYTMSQPTRAYSGTISVPRSANNDLIFGGMRHFGMRPRDYLTETWATPGNVWEKVVGAYVAKVFIGGVQIPGDFRAAVTCKETGYDIALSQTSVTAEQLPAKILQHVDIRGPGTGGAYNVNLNRVIAEAMNAPGDNVYFPYYAPNMQPVVRTTYESKAQSDIYVGQNVTLFYRFALDSDAGTRYLNNDIDIMEYSVRDPASFPTLGAYDTLFCEAIDFQEVTLDVSFYAGPPPSLAIRDKTHKAVIVSLSPIGDLTDKTHVRYKMNSKSAQIRVGGPTGYSGMYITTLSNNIALDVHPPYDMDSEAAFKISYTITSVSGGGVATVNGGLGTENARELLEGICKAMMWTYDFSIDSNNKVRLDIRPILNEDITTAEWRKGINGTTLQDWSEYYVSTEKIEDSSGFANSINGKIGEKSVWYTVARGMFKTKQEVFSASVPYKMDGSLPRLLFWNTSTNVAVDYFFTNEYLYNTFRKYYDLFNSGIDVTINANIPLLQFNKIYRRDGAVWLDAFKCWFYVRSVSDFSVATGACKIKLTKLNI